MSERARKARQGKAIKEEEEISIVSDDREEPPILYCFAGHGFGAVVSPGKNTDNQPSFPLSLKTPEPAEGGFLGKHCN
ncbi:hypothetical protein E2C01_032541 [Portunus trituberculatus]|uniref:Uncharacterized protein n=1 Tax=Portunus trituberculatus TaxID=210409 RepID=A0A5B7EXS6_PORTR|nr:hypothetical protein [Portunus trituberculatus]